VARGFLTKSRIALGEFFMGKNEQHDQGEAMVG